MRDPAGYVSGAPVGPVCLANLVGRAEVRRSRKTAVVAVDQPDLFGGECGQFDNGFLMLYNSPVAVESD
jgi:hypothetical protein